MRDRYDSVRRARQVEAPVLVVMAGEDEIIPRARSEALASAFAPGQVEVVVVPGVGHNTLDMSPVYLQSVGGVSVRIAGQRMMASGRNHDEALLEESLDPDRDRAVPARVSMPDTTRSVMAALVFGR